MPTYNYRNLSWLDVSDNNFDGLLQENIGKMIPNLEYLNLSRNHFEGNLPSSIGDMIKLGKFDLSNNNFIGEVPTKLVYNCTDLVVLKLSNNKFHCEIFSQRFLFFVNNSLHVLELNDNLFNGTLPATVSTDRVMGLLDISNNCLSGTIPNWLGDGSNLWYLDMSNNFFKGQMPCMSGHVLIDLSNNFLSGLLPSCSSFFYTQHLFLQGNKLRGSLPKDPFSSFRHSSRLVTLDIRDNRFSGTIPTT